MDLDGKEKRIFHFLDNATRVFEIIIAFLLLIVIMIKLLDLVFELTNIPAIILEMEFERILSILFNLVIGVEFIRMLYKHTPVTVIYVLLFATARHIILNYEGVMHLMVGVISIAGLFAVKKYFTCKYNRLACERYNEDRNLI